MKLVLNIKNEDKAKSLIAFLKDIPYVEISENGVDDVRAGVRRVPAEFRKPVTAKKYARVSRDDIYEDRIH